MKKIIKNILFLTLMTCFGLVHAHLTPAQLLLKYGPAELGSRYPKAIAFIRKEINTNRLDSRSIQIVPGASWHCKWVESENYVMSVPENGLFSLKALETALENNKDITPYQFVIAHELNHQWFNHDQKRALVQLGNAVGMTAFAILVHTILYCNKEKLGAIPHMVLQILAPSLEVCLIAKNPAVYAYIRSLEQEADNNVRDDINVLKGGITFLAAHKSNEIKTWAQKLISTHPEISTRIAELEKRIKSLEAQA